MNYTFRCVTHGRFLTNRSIRDTIPRSVPCPICGELSLRDFRSDLPLGTHYHSQGFHKTDYDAHGDKLEQLNRAWSKATGEAPPPPSTKVPRNSSEPY